MIHETAKVHPSAIIEEGASIGANVSIGPFSYIGTDVIIGDGTQVLSHVVIKGPTSIGKDNKIFQFASIGEECQDLKYKGEPTRLEIGDRNIIRESVSMHRGTTQDKGITKVGHDNLFMINVHVAHDCEIGNRCILANNATLAGHVKVADFAIIGGMSAVHQFCRIGEHSMVGGASGVAQDVPPFVIAQGNHATPFGVNYEGLKRRGFDKDEIHAIRRAYKAIYRNKNTVEEAKAEMAEDAKTYASVAKLSEFIVTSARGIIR